MARALALATIILAHVGFLVPSDVPRRLTEQEERGGFRHVDHVRRDWGKVENGEPSEYARDCRGCHFYRGQDDTRDPQAVCESCHLNGDDPAGGPKALTLDPSRTTADFLDDLDKLRTPDRPFRHWSHREYKCASCHEGTSGKPDDPGRAGDVKFRPGWHTCLECHDPKGSQAIDRDPSGAKNLSFVQGLNTYLSKRAARPEARFRHDEHLARGTDRDMAACAPCHGQITSAPSSRGPAALGPREVDRAACARCHLTDDPGKPIETGFERRDHACALLGTFPHDLHCNENARSKDATIREQGCLACHTSVDNGRTYGLQSVFREDLYKACSACHDKLEPNPLRVVDAAGVDDHGKVQNCDPCHTFGAGTMKDTRPSTEVSRRRPSAFAFVTHDHPVITLKGGKLEQGADCRKCHRATLDGGLRTRIGRKRFSHDTHLPPSPTAADCDKCHADVSGAATPGDLKLYSDASCSECHKGLTPDPARPPEERKVQAVFDGPASRRRVPTFPHQLHLDAVRNRSAADFAESSRDAFRKLSQGCIACHVPKQGGATEVGTLPEALDCSLCHDHDKPDICADKDRAYVSTCAKCHGDAGPVVGEPFDDFREFAKGLSGAQWHPNPADRRCDECHLPGASVFERPKGVFVIAKLQYEAGSFHARFDKESNLKVPRDQKCADCHWHQMIARKELIGSGLLESQLYRLADEAKDKVPPASDYPGRQR